MSTYTQYIFIDHNQIFNRANFLITKEFYYTKFFPTMFYYHEKFLSYQIFSHSNFRSHLVLATWLERDHLTTTLYIRYTYNIHLYINNRYIYLHIHYRHTFDHILFSPAGWSVIKFPPFSTSGISAISIYISTVHTYIYISTIDIHSITSCSRHLAGA